MVSAQLRFLCWVCVGVVLCCAFWSPRSAWADGFGQREQSCIRSFQEQRFLRSARCFDSLFRSIPTSQRKRFKQERGGWLYNAVLSWRKAAIRSGVSPSLAAWYRLQALVRLQRYVRLGFAETQTQYLKVMKLTRQLTRAIGFARLHLKQPKGATTHLTGFRYTRSLRSMRVKRRLLSGRYKLEVRLRSKKQLMREVVLLPGQTKVVSLQILQKQPPRWAPVSLLVGGVLLLASGVALAAVGGTVTYPSSERLLASAQTVEEVRLALGRFDEAQTQYALGWALCGVGGAVALSGAIYLVLQRTATEYKWKESTLNKATSALAKRRSTLVCLSSTCRRGGGEVFW